MEMEQDREVRVLERVEEWDPVEGAAEAEKAVVADRARAKAKARVRARAAVADKAKARAAVAEKARTT